MPRIDGWVNLMPKNSEKCIVCVFFYIINIRQVNIRSNETFLFFKKLLIFDYFGSVKLIEKYYSTLRGGE